VGKGRFFKLWAHNGVLKLGRKSAFSQAKVYDISDGVDEGV